MPTVSSMILLALTVSLIQIQPSHADDTVILKDVKKEFVASKLALTISFDKSPLYHVYRIKNNEALFIDLIGSNIVCLEPLRRELNLAGIKTYEIMFYPGYEPKDNKAGIVDGVVIYLSMNTEYTVISDANTVQIIFPGMKEAGISQSASDVQLPESFSFTPEKQTPPLDEETQQEAILGWRKWIGLGIENHRPLHIAKEQYELAQLKLRESRRQLFPTAVIRVIDTEGKTVGDVGIFSKSAELEFEQPLSYGGELRYKIEQADINMELALLEYQRLSSDFALELKRNYYNVILNRMNWDTFNKLLSEANKIMTLGELLYQKGLITELEYKQMQSSYEQIKFLFVSTQKELSLAELSFRQTLNISQDANVEFANWLPFEKVNIDFDSALKIAQTRRAELRIRQLITQFNNLNEQIAKSKDRFRISLTGKVGTLAEDNEGEEEIFRDSWYVGLKVSRPLGSSTINTSLTKQTTPVGSFRLGDETETFTRSMEVNLVDRLSVISDEKTARVEFLKAISEEIETEETIVSEAEKAYANYISSLFQIETSLKKLEFQSRRLTVTEGKMKVEEASITELLQAYLDYSNEEVNYSRALVGYYIALSSLSRVCAVDSYLSLATEKPVILAWENFSQRQSLRASYTPFALPEFKKEARQAIPTGVEGRVIGVNNKYSMAVLNIGRDKGLGPESKVMVYREGNEYALLVPARIEKETAVCYLEEGSGEKFKGLRIGDKVEILR